MNDHRLNNTALPTLGIADESEQTDLLLELENQLYQEPFQLSEKCTVALRFLARMLPGLPIVLCVARPTSDGLSVFNGKDLASDQDLKSGFLDLDLSLSSAKGKPITQAILINRLQRTPWASATKIPMTIGDHCLGALIVDTGENVPDPDEMTILNQVARVFGRARYSRSVIDSLGREQNTLRQIVESGTVGSGPDEAQTKQIEEQKSKIDQSLEYEKCLITCSRVLLASGNEDNNLATALEQLLRASGARRIILSRNGKDGYTTTLTHAISRSRDRLIRSDFRNKKVQFDEVFMSDRQALTRGEISTGTAGMGADGSMTLKKLGMSNYLLTPIMMLGEWCGIIGYSTDDETPPWAEHDIEMLQSGADMIGIYFEREHMGRKIRKSEETMRALLNASSFSAILVNEGGIVLDLNDNALNLLDVTKDTVIGTYLTDRVDVEYMREIESLYQVILNNKKPHAVEYMTNGRYFDISGFPIFGTHKDKIERVAIYLRDNTQHKISEHEESHKIKMESIGQLAAGIAHEINSPMQYISNYSQFLEGAFTDLEELLEAVDKLDKESQAAGDPCPTAKEIRQLTEDMDLEFLREEIPNAIEHTNKGIGIVTKIVSSMKTFSHPDSKNMAAVDLNESIESTTTVSRNEWKYVAELMTDFDPDLPVVTCFVSEINQAILNMIVNAAHAIADTMDDGEGPSGLIGISTYHDDGWAEIKITDTGSGMEPEIAQKIFDPFFTTKEVGKGTGQGLAITHSVIVKKHGGTIDVESEPGHGTTFTIRIPVKPQIMDEPDGEAVES
jgi:signal transduction histidine kinase